MNTILFDLDGTLLPLNNEIFETEYFKLLSLKLGHIFNPRDVVKYIWEATLEMVKNNEAHRSNKEVFMDKFEALTGQNIDHMNELFTEFYRNEYQGIGKLFQPSVHMINSVELLKDKGYNLVVATNPLFPMEAILQRIKWAGLEPSDFALVTSFEDMHFCKPNPNYYREILNKIKRLPEECLMVGNDAEEDMAAGELGIKTYLIEDNILNKRGIEPTTTYRGSYEEFYRFVTALPKVAETSEG